MGVHPHRPWVAGIAGTLALVLLLTVASQSTQAQSGSTDRWSYELVASVLLQAGYDPVQITYDGANGDLYIPSFDGASENGSVFVVSGATNSIVATPIAGWNPEYAGVDPSSGNVYVSNRDIACSNCPPNYRQAAPNVTVLSGTTNSAVASVRLMVNSTSNPFWPSGIAFDGRNGDVYVADGGVFGMGGGAITIISGLNNSVVTNVRVPGTPYADFYDSLNDDIYVITDGANLTVISGATNTVVSSIPIPGGPVGPDTPVLNPSTGDLYVVGGTGFTILSGSTNRIIKTVPVPGGIGWSAGGFVDSEDNIWMLQGGDPGNVTILSGATNAILSTFPIGDADEMAFDPAGGVILSYSNSGGSGMVNVTSEATHALIENLETPRGYFTTPMVYDPGNGELYVVGNVGGTLYAFANVSVAAAASTNSYGASWVIAAAGVGFGAGVLVMAVAIRFLRRRRRGRSLGPASSPDGRSG